MGRGGFGYTRCEKGCKAGKCFVYALFSTSSQQCMVGRIGFTDFSEYRAGLGEFVNLMVYTNSSYSDFEFQMTHMVAMEEGAYMG